MRWLLLLLILGATVIALITEYRRRRSIEARSRAILSSSFTDLAILDRNGVVEDCNDSVGRYARQHQSFHRGETRRTVAA